MEHSIKVDSIKRYDVAVCGGGMTGTAAATAAARAGAKTLLIEKNGCLGGVATSGSVRCILGGMDYKEGEYLFVTGGLFKELYYDLLDEGGCVDVYGIDRERSPHAWFSGLANSIIFDNESMKRLLDRKVLESGSDLLYFTNIIDSHSKDDKIEYVVTSNKSGIEAVYADCFIDCTGDADLAALSKNTVLKGREGDNLMTPATLIMNLENVDTERVLEYIEKNDSPRFRHLINELREKGEWPFPFEIFISMLLTRPGQHMVNSIRQVGVDGLDARSLTAAMIDGRKENKLLFDILGRHFPGYEKAHMSETAECVGIRETRRIKGKFTLELDMLLNGVDFEDTIALSSYCFDLPDPKKPSYQPLEGKKTAKEYTHIPYRCLLPDRSKNLLVAGRSISVERDVLGPVRVMGPCMGMGQAAGTAAAISAKTGENPEDLSFEDLEMKLEEAGCITNEKHIEKVRRKK